MIVRLSAVRLLPASPPPQKKERGVKRGVKEEEEGGSYGVETAMPWWLHYNGIYWEGNLRCDLQ